MPPLEKTNLAEAFARIAEPWRPKLVARLNGQAVKLAKLRGPFLWHQHADADELFLVVRGRFRMELRDDPADPARERTLALAEGDLLVVPKGVEHRPVADDDADAEVLLFEPLGTRNTGEVEDARLTAPTDVE
ncbi:MAG TPA: cupin domain-containing protein [Gemmatimonadales bacterium]|nr:cupin domain-containing protein [Gemmatimonadales bacterium]